MVNQILDTRDIDQIYSPESENAQSGTAVMEALSTKANLQFKEIDNIDVTLFDGNSFKKPDIYTVLSTKVIESGAVDVTLSSGFNLWCDTEGIFKEGCHYLIDAHLTEDSGDGITHWRTNYFAEALDLEDKVNVEDIDQTYIPESPNAQSGKAVAEAISGKADKEEWVMIDSVKLEQDGFYSVTENVYTKEPLNLKKFMILVWHEAKAENTVGNSLWLHAKTPNSGGYKYALQSSSYKGNVQSTHRFDGELWYYWNIRAFAAQGHYVSPSNMAYSYLTVPYGCRGEFIEYREPITGFRVTFGTDGLLNAGTRIEVWGVNA